MLLQIPFEPGQKPAREHLFHFQAGFKMVQKRLSHSSPVLFLINLPSTKKTDSKNLGKSVNMFLLARAMWESNSTDLGSRIPSGC